MLCASILLVDRLYTIFPRDENSVADIHTHWIDGGNTNFSFPEDYNASYDYEQIEQIFLVNRFGKLMRSERANNELGYTIGYEVYSSYYYIYKYSTYNELTNVTITEEGVL